MTTKEINKRIAEACPKLFRIAKMSGDVIWIDPDGYDIDCSPDDDLNAMHAVIFTQPKHIKVLFSIKLREVVSRHHVNWDFHSEGERNYYTENATALQRAEAFLRTIGRWE